MCNILILKPGQMIPQEDFWNMCYNNWHSYGLVTKVDGKLDVKKKVPKSGEIDPQELWDLCQADIQYERIVHVRHTTAGTTTLDNCHPFDLYYDQASGKHVMFAHNGTLYQYKSKKYDEKGIAVDDDTGPSDTQNFATKILQPLLAGWNGGTGKADIHNEMFKRIVREFWPATSNRGIIIANDQASFIFGDWKKMKIEDGSEVITANEEYFSTVKRGPEYSRREAARRKAAEDRNKCTTNSSNSMIPVTNVDSFHFGVMKEHFKLTSSLTKIFDDYNVWQRPGSAALAAATRDELLELYEDKAVCIALMDHIFTDYYKMYEELLGEEEDHQRASKMIAVLKRKLEEAGLSDDYKEAA